ncbi:MAG: methylated-DNA--[protein]-cysteine S-methyltransferase [Candidatus Xiphinematobacter sp.]|nr:MAG: methylated-DNA--[protein]-cysteine S-methyltransferase [Candidatus Xiphinematobacter sp.]QQY09245.1 MAG: methylated-DNA--[protein]-cysteine S-methyltransferase [Candidatus Xiphinematobacter sp.]QQY11473.1 MAG: methylated-DNA--[protein]-cysteine S-methyltransferase [Candidatus Xiphinematobacter sp.]
MSKADVLPPGAIRVSTLLGEMLLASDGHALVFATFVDTFPHDLSSVSAGPGGGCLGNFFQEVSYQMDNYLHGRQRKFTVPVCPRGPHFSQRVWSVLTKIPPGSWTTYGAVADDLGCPKSARAVGAACRRNPIAIFIPCHRVLSKSRQLAGYTGGLCRKALLLYLERIFYS